MAWGGKISVGLISIHSFSYYISVLYVILQCKVYVQPKLLTTLGPPALYSRRAAPTGTVTRFRACVAPTPAVIEHSGILTAGHGQ